MKFQIFKHLFLLLIAFLWPMMARTTRSYYYLEVRVKNILVKKGTLYIGVYNNESSFKNDIYYKGKSVIANRESISIKFKLPKGKYAIKIYQDINGDGKMNNIFGIPLEPYGISGNESGFPHFSVAKFGLNKNKIINIQLKN